MSMIDNETRQKITDISLEEADKLYSAIITELDKLQGSMENGVPIVVNMMLKISSYLLANVMSNSMDINHRDAILGGLITDALITEQKILEDRKIAEEQKECMN